MLGLNRYQDFFSLFGHFRHYLEFFLLDDLVDPHCVEIRWYLPFDDFNRSPLPQTPDEYETYRQASLCFVRDRNRRILEWASMNLA
ncbi:MAG: hypothetical protein WCF36_19390 [Candidatus Nanopelagicales bacterium]